MELMNKWAMSKVSYDKMQFPWHFSSNENKVLLVFILDLTY